MIEHYAGRLPLWLSPVQAVLLNITDRQETYLRECAEMLQNQGLRVEIDLRNEKLGYKIREHTLQRIPYLLVAGDKEVEAKALAVRTLTGKDLGAMPLESLVARLKEEVTSRGLRKVED
jgi:threonyl-tRNA synthetase